MSAATNGTDRPVGNTANWDAVPAELKALRQWVRWRYVKKPGDKKPSKVPYHPMEDRPAAVDDPSTWGTFEETLANVGAYDGIGFVFTGGDPYVGYDVDGCINGTGLPAPYALEIIERFGTYAEVSPSGTGVKGICRAEDIPGLAGKATGHKEPGFEVYKRGRFFTITAWHFPGTPTECREAQAAVNWFVETHILPKRKAGKPRDRVAATCEPPLTDRVKRASAYLARMPESISGQGGHDAAFRAALALVRGFALPVGQALDLMLAEFNPRCQPPWSDREIEHKVESASSDGSLPMGYLLAEPPPRDHGAAESPSVAPPEPSAEVHGEDGGGGKGTSGDPPAWGPPLALPPELDPVPTLDESMLPGPLRAWIKDEAERLGVVLEFVAVAALVIAGSLIGRQLLIFPKAEGVWPIVANLWATLIGRPSSKKSPSQNVALRPLRKIAKAHDEAWAENAKRYRAEIEVLKAKRKKTLERVGSKNGVSDDQAIADVAELDQKIEKLTLLCQRRRFLTNDCTIEAQHRVLSENPIGVLQHRDELVGWIASMDREGHENDRSFYLEAWDGGASGSSYESDRIGRGNVRAEGLCVSVLGGMQPGRLKHHVLAALRDRAEADGFLQRFQLAVWPDRPCTSTGIDRKPNGEAWKKALSVLEKLTTIDPSRMKAVSDGEEDIPHLRLSDDAQRAFDAWHTELLRRTASEEMEECPAFEAHLTKYAKLVPALALIFHVLDSAADQTKAGPVSLDALNLALDWARFLEAHARKIYSPELDTSRSAGHAMARKILSGHLEDGMTVGEIGERDWTGLHTTGRVHAALDFLEQFGWVRRDRVSGQVGRPKTFVRMNPGLKARVAAPDPEEQDGEA